MRNQVSLARRQASRLRFLKIGALILSCIFACLFGSVAVQGARTHDAAPSVAMVPLLAVGGLMFREAHQGGGGGGGSDEFPKTQPELTGETPEVKLQNAGTIIADLFKRGLKACSDLAAKTQAYLELETTAKKSALDLTAEKDAHTATKGLLDTEKTNHGATSGKLVKSEERVTHLEGLCKLKGLDPDQVVPPAPAAKSGDDERAELVSQLNAAKTPEERGEIAGKLRDFDAKAKRKTAKEKAE